MSQFPTCSHGFGDPNADCPACESEAARAVLVEMIEEMITLLDDIVRETLEDVAATVD